MSETLSIDFAQPIPVFPLPQCALLPHATIPLHVFEARYRRMVRDALGDNRLIAMATFEGLDWKDDYQGSPPIRPCVCIGYLIRHERLADGRYNVLLQGICRARVLHEMSNASYRTALLEPTESRPAMEIDLDEQRSVIEQLLDQPPLRELASVSAIHNWLSPEIPTPAAVDLAIMTITDDTEARYRMLAEPDATLRGDWLIHELKHIRQVLLAAERMGECQTPDGWFLN